MGCDKVTNYSAGVTCQPTGVTYYSVGVMCHPTGVTYYSVGVMCHPTGVTYYSVGVMCHPTGVTYYSAGVINECVVPTGFERQVPGYPRYSYAGDPSLGQHHLVISGITITEDGEYQCQVGPTQTNPPIWASANVTVLVPPRSVEFSGWRDGAVVEVVAGVSLTLQCLVKDARPAPSVWWYRDGLQLDQGSVQERVEESSLPRRWSVRSRLVVTATAEDDGKLYTCEADHPALREASHPLLASIMLSVLHRPGPPAISGYKTGEVLVAGERRTLVCRVSGGNPRPWVTWHRQGLLLDDTTTADASGVINTHQLTATAADDGVIYECRVRSDLLEKPLVANVSLTVYYVPSFVSLTGPSQVEEGAPISLTCETSKSNPPASLVWRVQGETVTGEPETMVRVSTGGWVTTSQLTHYKVRSRKVTEVVVECKALNPAIDQTVTKTRIIAITKPAGPPRFEGDLHRQFLAGTTIDLLCSSMGGHPAPTIRIYKEEEEIPTEVVREMNVTRGRAKVGLTPADNGAKVTCEVTSVGSTSAPLTASARLTKVYRIISIRMSKIEAKTTTNATTTTTTQQQQNHEQKQQRLLAPWEVTGSMTPATVEEGALVSLSCESSSSLPPSNITWRSDGVTIDDATVTSNQGAFGGTSTRSEMQLRTTAGDNGKMFLCEADNGLGPAVHTTLTLHVLREYLLLSYFTESPDACYFLLVVIIIIIISDDDDGDDDDDDEDDDDDDDDDDGLHLRVTFKISKSACQQLFPSLLIFQAFTIVPTRSTLLPSNRVLYPILPSQSTSFCMRFTLTSSSFTLFLYTLPHSKANKILNESRVMTVPSVFSIISLLYASPARPLKPFPAYCLQQSSSPSPPVYILTVTVVYSICCLDLTGTPNTHSLTPLPPLSHPTQLALWFSASIQEKIEMSRQSEFQFTLSVYKALQMLICNFIEQERRELSRLFDSCNRIARSLGN
ncbi:Nephrin-like 18, partial [Homarus americanus]